jgi:hypothetical protein
MCHRAMLIDDGELKFIGDPDDTALRYYRLNFAGPHKERPGEPQPMIDFNAKVISATLRDDAGAAIENVEQDVPMSIDVVIEAARGLGGPSFVFHVRNDDGVVVFSFTTKLDERVAPGQRIRLKGSIENKLVPGRYFLDVWVRQDDSETVFALQGLRLLGFVVFGTGPEDGLVNVVSDIDVSLEP